MSRTWASLFRQSTIGRVLVNATWGSAAIPFLMLFGVIQTALLARILGPNGVGVLGIFIALRVLFSGIFRLTSAETILVFANKALTDKDHIEANSIIRYCYFSDISTSLLTFFIMIIAVNLFTELLNVPQGYVTLFSIYALTVIFNSSFWVSHALLRLANKYSLTFWVTINVSIVKTFLYAVILLSDGGLLEVVLALLAVEILNSVLIFLFLFRSLQASDMQLQFGRIAVRSEIIRFQLAVHGRQIMKAFNRSVDVILIGYLSTPTEVGYYRGGKQITDQMHAPTQGLRASLFPEYSRLWFAKQYQELRKLTSRLFLGTLVVGVLGTLVVWFSAEFIVKLILGEAFLPAVGVIRILMIAGFIQLIMSPIYSLPPATGKAAVPTWATGIALLLQVMVMLILVPEMGAVGAAWSNVAYYLTWVILLVPTIVSILYFPPNVSTNEDSEYATANESVLTPKQ